MLLLQDILDAPSFNRAVDNLADDFRVKHGLPGIRQLGVVVPDVESAARMLEARGVGQFTILDGSPVFWLEDGESRNVSGKVGLASHDDIELELLQPTEGSDFYRRSLDPLGRPVIHHAGLFVEDVDKSAEGLIASGAAILVRGQLKMGPVLVEFAYMDTSDEAGLILEFIAWRIRGRPFVPPPGVVRGAGWLERLVRRRSVKE